MELGGKYLSYKKKHLVRFWMSTEDVERTFIDPEEITVLGDCCNGYTPLLEVNQALIAWSYRQPRQ